MNTSFKGLAVCCTLLSLVLVAGGSANADPPRPIFLPAVVPSDFKLLRIDASLFRFDARTGTTELLTGKAWSSMFTGGASPPSMDAELGRYDVAPGMGDSPRLIRIDKKTGKTWGLTSTPASPMPIVRWQDYGGGGAPTSDFKLLKAGSSLYRFDTKTGTTELFTLNGANGTWSSMFSGQASPTSMAGEPGRYEVVAGFGDGPKLFRTDTRTGKTWGLTVTPASPMPIVRWQELTPR